MAQQALFAPLGMISRAQKGGAYGGGVGATRDVGMHAIALGESLNIDLKAQKPSSPACCISHHLSGEAECIVGTPFFA